MSLKALPPPLPPITLTLPPSVLERYKHFEDLVDVGRSAAGERVTLPDGAVGLALREIFPDSPLSTLLGFQTGDTILTVNGLAVDRDAARALYEQLRDARRFEVVIIRDGERRTVVFAIE